MLLHNLFHNNYILLSAWLLSSEHLVIYPNASYCCMLGFQATFPALQEF
jgi:hypothetical protein